MFKIDNHNAKSAFWKNEIKTLRLIMVLVIVFILSKVAGARDPQLPHPLYLAPSYAGHVGEAGVNSNYHLQWPGMPEAL